jgi:hypothetical protein
MGRKLPIFKDKNQFRKLTFLEINRTVSKLSRIREIAEKEKKYGLGLLDLFKKEKRIFVSFLKISPFFQFINSSKLKILRIKT